MAHTNQVGDIETSGWGRWESDHQEQRAKEFEEIGLARKAERMRDCGLGVKGWRCRIRGCFRCAAWERAEFLMPETLAAIRSIRPKRRRVGVLNVLSRNKRDLRGALDLLRKALAGMRREMLLLGIRRSVVAIEPVLAVDRRRWNVHAHVVLECHRSAIPDIEVFWKKATKGRGHFVLDGRKLVDDPGALANYMTKVDACCPRPGSLALDDLLTLQNALKDRHLHLRWGFDESRRKPKIWTIWRRAQPVEQGKISRAGMGQTIQQNPIEHPPEGRTGSPKSPKIRNVLGGEGDRRLLGTTGNRKEAAGRVTPAEQRPREAQPAAVKRPRTRARIERSSPKSDVPARA